MNTTTNTTMPLTGVAPDATIYMYRVFDCTSSGGATDVVMAAMERAAFVDGVDVVSMSLGVGRVPVTDAPENPIAAVVRALGNAGVAVVSAAGNAANGARRAQSLYTGVIPGSEPGAIGVGSVANAVYPLAYPMMAVGGGTQQEMTYASVWPVDVTAFGGDLDVLLLADGCDNREWDAATANLAAAGSLNRTIVVFPVSDSCRPTDAQGCCRSPATSPRYIMGYWTDSSDTYETDFYVPSPGFFGSVTQSPGLSLTDGLVLVASYSAAGGHGKYKLSFPHPSAANFSSPRQKTGGFVDFYSSRGPTRREFDLKPQLTAPGGNILSTWPLGAGTSGSVGGGYAIISGTSMATPYVAGCYALIKSAFPDFPSSRSATACRARPSQFPGSGTRPCLQQPPSKGPGSSTAMWL